MIQIETIYELFKRSSGICTDTRKIEKNQLFIALRGDHFDGNDYALNAIEGGAKAAIVDRRPLAMKPHCFYVPNTLSTLQKLAFHHRNQFNIPVLAITGTNGKTTTKELIRSVLSQEYQTIATVGNLNNHIGVPLTLLRMTSETEVAVIEMGANHQGEIAWLCNIANPTTGLVTNVGNAHLEGFGTRSNIWDTKMALYRFLERRDLVSFINEEEPSLHSLKEVAFANAVRFDSMNLPGDVESATFNIRDRSIFVSMQRNLGEFHSVEVDLYGDHNRQNILCAIGIGLQFGISMENILKGLEGYRSNQNRSQVIMKGSNTYYLDAYNANPTSMKMALKFFRNLEVGNKMLILGDMKELGDQALGAHEEVLTQVEEFEDLRKVILVGPIFSAAFGTNNALRQSYKLFENVSQAGEFLKTLELTNTHLLLKGSRGVGLEALL